ncbi:MAG: SPOR domain-containing protein [Bacteroidales bacterium]|nr:SPOR domain-containing protein [Bacteroidales bacterium]
MKLKILYAFVISIFLYSSCGNVKERKTDVPEGNVENVTSYTDPIESETDNDILYSDSLESNLAENTVLSGEDEFSGFVSDSIDEIENAVPEQIIVENSSTEVENNNASTEIVSNNTSTAVSSSVTSTSTKSGLINYKRYYVIAGSFKNLTKAQGLNKQFNKEGVKSYISGPINGYHRVIVGKYNQKKVALKDLTKLRRKYLKLRFWLLGEM